MNISIPEPTRTHYTSYDQIPAEVRRFILDESGERRVKRVSLAMCNELANEFYEFQAECAELKKFELHVQRGRDTVVHKFTDFQSSIVAFDREIKYNIGSRGVTMVLLQAGRPLRGYENGRVIFSKSIYG